MKVILIVSLAIITFAIGCTKNVPKCNDPDVVGTVKEIISEQECKELKELMGSLYLASTLGNVNNFDYLFDYLYLNNLKNREYFELLKKITSFVKDSKFDESAVNGLADVSKYTVNSIVTNRIEPDISKCNCSAKVEWHPLSDDYHLEGNITYDVQYTTDGKEYIVTLQDYAEVTLMNGKNVKNNESGSDE